jgi:putative tryptophan/tyrosine transport system substrate-binding protein
MRRRDFIAGVGAAVWPLVARAQQPALPVVGYFSQRSPGVDGLSSIPGFKQGLSQNGFIEGRNVAIEYRYAEGHFDRLPALVHHTQRGILIMALLAVRRQMMSAATAAFP